MNPASSSSSSSAPLVLLKDLSRDFAVGGGLWRSPQTMRAVRGVTLAVRAGETLGVVGESGCGKSTLARMAVGLLPPTSGEVFFGGKALYDRSAHADYAAFRAGLAGRIQMVFQDPYSSLNPRMRVGSSVAEPLLCASGGAGFAGGKEGPAAQKGQKNPGAPPPLSRAGVRDRVAEMLELVGMGADSARRYPHEFSGGQRQRIAIARSLITRPAFVVCDEPTSSLDASVQAQVLNLLLDLQESFGLSYLFISHDLSVVRHMSDRVAVMRRGEVVEEGCADDVFARPAHPYTRLLLDSIPGAGAEGFYAQGHSGPGTVAGQRR